MKNKNNIYLISIGYPIGIIEINEKVRYQVECGGHIFGLSVKSCSIWQLALGGMHLDKVMEIYTERFGIDISFKGELNNIINSELLIELDMNNKEETYKKIEYLKPFRQGKGKGLNVENNKYYVKTDNEIGLTAIDFTTWMNSNGNLTIKEFVEDYKNTFKKDEKRAKFEVMQIIFYLYKIGLIYLVR